MARSFKQSAEAWLTRQWYAAEAPWAGLLPLELAFRSAVALRRLAYRNGLKASTRLPVPVIVVGNLSVGGVGKTPLVVWIVQTLLEQGYRPGVISRGFGGTGSTEPLAVTGTSDPDRVGDESVLIALRCGVPVYVHRDRVRAGKALLAAHDCDVIVSDDGLQHYGLARDLEIAVVDGERGFGNRHLLPAGPLREPVRRLDEVDLVVQRSRGGDDEIVMSIRGKVAVNLLNPQVVKPLAEFRREKLVAVAGIGYPQRFFDLLTEEQLDFEQRPFPDHHRFCPNDLRHDRGAVIMTEKDAVKCRVFASLEHWYVPVSAELSGSFRETFLTLLQVKIDGQKAP